MVSAIVDQWTEKILVEYRWVFVCLFLLPLSTVYNVWFYLRNWLVFKLNSAPGKHDEKVLHVQNQVIAWNRSGRRNRLCTARPGVMAMSFRIPKYKATSTQIAVDLVDVLEVDEARQTVRVEPLANMGQVTATLNPLGWTLPVVPELDDLTVGGLLMGTGVETSSHIYGLFQSICVSMDLVLPDGTLIRCSRDQNEDLYHAAFWSHGTLGFLVAAELRIVKYHPYVRLQYHPCFTLKDTVDTFTKFSESPSCDFVEGVAFSAERSVVMTGSFSTGPENRSQINAIGKYYKPWFFKHVESVLQQKLFGHVEYIPTRDYYHRHTKSIFWELQDIIPFGNSLWFRYLLGWSVPPKVSFLKQTQTAAVKRLYEQHHMIQDMLVPIRVLGDAINVFDEKVKLYPLWLCPFTVYRNPGLVQPTGDDDELFVDIGAYGEPKRSFDPKGTTRALESYVRSVKGYQMLYADTYMTRDEFRNMFNHSLYDEVRTKYDCHEAFPEIYGKVCRESRI